MIKTNFRFFALLVVLGLMTLFTGCNQADQDINPTEQRNNPVIATDDKVQVKPGSGVVIDLFQNDKITTSAGVTLIEEYLKKGTAKFIKQGVVLYMPTDSSGTDTLAYTICPPGQPCDTGAVEITIGPDIPDTTQGAMPDFATTSPDQSVGIDVLANDKFGDSTNQNTSNQVVDIVQNPANGNTVVDNGYYVTYTPNQGFKGTDQFVYGVRNANSNSYLGYGVVTVTVQDSTNGNDCVIEAVDDSSSVRQDSLGQNGTYTYVDVLNNDELCNTQAEPVVIDNGGINDVSFVNGQLRVKLYSTDQSGTYIVDYALKENGVEKARAKVNITVLEGTSGCTITSLDDELNVQQDSLSQNGTYIYVDVLANDELCNTQAEPVVIDNGGFNDVSFVNGQLRVKIYPTDQTGIYTIRYALKEDGVVKVESDVKITVQ